MSTYAANGLTNARLVSANQRRASNANHPCGCAMRRNRIVQLLYGRVQEVSWERYGRQVRHAPTRARLRPGEPTWRMTIRAFATSRSTNSLSSPRRYPRPIHLNVGLMTARSFGQRLRIQGSSAIQHATEMESLSQSIECAFRTAAQRDPKSPDRSGATTASATPSVSAGRSPVRLSKTLRLRNSHLRRKAHERLRQPIDHPVNQPR